LGGHSIALGNGTNDILESTMHSDFNIDLIQQLENMPMYNILDLAIWQAA
jgi:soluble P-type ATPase